MQETKDLKNQLPDSPEANQHMRDVNSRMIFRNPVLCAQFLRDNIDIPFLKHVQPEDIKDVTERYQPFIGVEFETDTVKQIHLTDEMLESAYGTTLLKSDMTKNRSLFLVSLIEHKSQVDYNISIQLLRYITCIWTEYGKEMETHQKGCTRTKGFRYPPVLPIVYYEGSQTWSADMHLRNRIWMNELFEGYLPDFTYQVIQIQDYSNAELLARENAMALVMMLNKIQEPKDIRHFFESNPAQIQKILENTEESVKKIISETFYGLMMKMKMEQEEALQYAGMLKEGHMGYLWENMEKMDIQAERKNTADARALAEKEKARADEAVAKADEATAQNQLLFKALISSYQSNGMTAEFSIKKLMQECKLEETKARQLVELFWT